MYWKAKVNKINLSLANNLDSLWNDEINYDITSVDDE